jgi:hypothetical protein
VVGIKRTEISMWGTRGKVLLSWFVLGEDGELDFGTFLCKSSLLFWDSPGAGSGNLPSEHIGLL